MKTEEIIFTEETLILLYNRAFEFCKAKYGVEVNCLNLEEGYLVGIEEDRCGDAEFYEINVNELNNTDLDVLISERFEKERIRKEQEAEAKRLIAEQNRIRKEKEEYKKYLELKVKFEQS